MTEVLIRASGQDAPFLHRLFGLDGVQRRRAGVPDRIVVDAHSASKTPSFGEIARRAGVPFLVDPQTFFLQDIQHEGHPWGKLPFGDHAISTPSEAASPTRRDALIEKSIEYQIEHGATSIIAPYVHMENANSGWLDVQAALWTGTRRYLDQNAIALPVIAVLAVGWRLLHPVQGPKALAHVMAALDVLAPNEVALAASRVAAGVKPGDRLMDLITTTEWIRRSYPVIAWQQGTYGEVCSAAGALGYETGVGWRERCDLPSVMSSYRRPPSGDGFGRRPVYITALGRSIPAATISALRSDRTLWPRLICADADCCPPAGAALLSDARAHAVAARVAAMSHLSAMGRPVWKWRELETKADKALDLANRINRVNESLGLARVDTSPMTAIQHVAHLRRLDGRSRRAA
jgi:hypothetical protein